MLALAFIKETSRTYNGATSEQSPSSLPRTRAGLHVLWKKSSECKFSPSFLSLVSSQQENEDLEREADLDVESPWEGAQGAQLRSVEGELGF